MLSVEFTMDYLEYARSIFYADIFATEAAGITIDAADVDYARCSMEIGRTHLNASGSVMGGALFTLADFAFAVAANMGNSMTVTMTSQITFLRPAVCKKLTAEAKCIKSGRTTCSYIVDVTDDSGTLVASVSATGCRTGKNIADTLRKE